MTNLKRVLAAGATSALPIAVACSDGDVGPVVTATGSQATETERGATTTEG